jgi:hypothetical protein
MKLSTKNSTPCWGNCTTLNTFHKLSYFANVLETPVLGRLELSSTRRENNIPRYAGVQHFQSISNDRLSC